jgi:hypothetical protein
VSEEHDGGGLALDGRAAASELAGPICILPGCRNSVSEQGMPCESAPRPSDHTCAQPTARP